MRLFRSFKFFEFRFKSLFLVLFFVIASFGFGNVFGMMVEGQPSGSRATTGVNTQGQRLANMRVSETMYTNMSDRDYKALMEYLNSQIKNQFDMELKNLKIAFKRLETLFTEKKQLAKQKAKELQEASYDQKGVKTREYTDANKEFEEVEKQKSDAESKLLYYGQQVGSVALTPWPIPEEIRAAFSTLCEEEAMNLLGFLGNNSTANDLYNAEFIYENIFKKVWSDICNIFDFKTDNIFYRTDLLQALRSIFIDTKSNIFEGQSPFNFRAQTRKKLNEIIEELRNDKYIYLKELEKSNNILYQLIKREFIAIINRFLEKIPVIEREVFDKTFEYFSSLTQDQKNALKNQLILLLNPLIKVYIEIRLLLPQHIETQFIEPYKSQRYNHFVEGRSSEVPTHTTTYCKPNPDTPFYLLSPNLAYRNFDSTRNIIAVNASYYPAYGIPAEGREPIGPTTPTPTPIPQQTTTTTVQPTSPALQPVTSFIPAPQPQTPAQPQDLTPEQQQWLYGQEGYLNELSNFLGGMPNMGANIEDIKNIHDNQLLPIINWINQLPKVDQVKELRDKFFALIIFARLILGINQNDFSDASSKLDQLAENHYALFNALRPDLQERVRRIHGYVQQQLQPQAQLPMQPQPPQVQQPVGPVRAQRPSSPTRAPSPSRLREEGARGNINKQIEGLKTRTGDFLINFGRAINGVYDYINQDRITIDTSNRLIKQLSGLLKEIEDLLKFNLVLPQGFSWGDIRSIRPGARNEVSLLEEFNKFLKNEIYKLRSYLHSLNKGQSISADFLVWTEPEDKAKILTYFSDQQRGNIKNIFDKIEEIIKLLRAREDRLSQESRQKQIESQIFNFNNMLNNLNIMLKKEIDQRVNVTLDLNGINDFKRSLDNLLELGEKKIFDQIPQDPEYNQVRERAQAVKKQIEEKLSELEILKLGLEEQGLPATSRLSQRPPSPLRRTVTTTTSQEETRRRAEEARREEVAREILRDITNFIVKESRNLEAVNTNLNNLNLADSGAKGRLESFKEYLNEEKGIIERNKSSLSRATELTNEQKQPLIKRLDDLISKIDDLEKMVQEKSDEIFARKLAQELQEGEQRRAQLFSFNSYGHRHRHR